MNEGAVGQIGSYKCHPVLLCKTYSIQNSTHLKTKIQIFFFLEKVLSTNKPSTQQGKQKNQKENYIHLCQWMRKKKHKIGNYVATCDQKSIL